jgi:2-methylisocitrate lyase-like PEP mutase family enzyme
MKRTIQQAQAEDFHRMHAGGKVLALVNAWDAASAKLIEQSGSPAIATTSAGMAWSLGYPDGEQLSLRELIEASARICRAVTTPVSIDIERGYGRTPTEVAATVRALLDVGVVGINIEDGVIPGKAELGASARMAENISAIRTAANEVGVRLFINARTDVYFLPTDDSAARFEEALQRARLYSSVGADGIFVPGLENLAEMAQMAQSITRPLNIYAGYAGMPSTDQLRSVGVRRVSLGCGPFQAVLALTQRIAREIIRDGTYTAMTADMLSAKEVNNLFSPAQQPV